MARTSRWVSGVVEKIPQQFVLVGAVPGVGLVGDSGRGKGRGTRGKVLCEEILFQLLSSIPYPATPET